MTETQEISALLLDTPHVKVILEGVQKELRNEEKRRREFYNWVTDDIKAEFINGEIIVHSPVKSIHAQASENLFRILSIYALKHQLGRVTHEKVMSRFTRNDYEPDIMFFDNEKANAIRPEQSLFPVPDFIVEILSDSTAERDRGVKFKDYEAHKVAEYWIVDVEIQVVEQYVINTGKYELIKKTDEGFIHCFSMKGLNLPVEAIFNEKKQFEFIKEII